MTRPSANNPGVDLFPFLAILICTMGTLILLMSVVNRNSGKADPQAVALAREKIDEQTQVQREELQWRIAHLRDSHEKTSEQLTDDRLRLSSAERNKREMLDQLEQMQRAAQLLEQAGSKADTDKQLTKAELDRLIRNAALARRQLADIQQRAANRKPSYSIIPFKGQYGTDRRPIYIECSDDGVTLQPEGVRLNPTDFAGPPGPGNPLASTLRAAREYLMQTNPDKAAEPYPLLLVRPSGVMAYYAVREAMQSWASDFGYDMIEEDWKLEFPPADKQLAVIEQQTLTESRQRIEWYVQNAASRGNERAARTKYRVSNARGGLVPEGNATMGERPIDSPWTNGGVPRRGGSGSTARGNGSVVGGDSFSAPGFAGGQSTSPVDAIAGTNGVADNSIGSENSNNGSASPRGILASNRRSIGAGVGESVDGGSDTDSSLFSGAANGPPGFASGMNGSGVTGNVAQNGGPSLNAADGGNGPTDGNSQPSGNGLSNGSGPSNGNGSYIGNESANRNASPSGSPTSNGNVAGGATQRGGSRSSAAVQPFGGPRSNGISANNNPTGRGAPAIVGMTPADALLATTAKPNTDTIPRDRSLGEPIGGPAQFSRPGEYVDPMSSDVRDRIREFEKKQREQTDKPRSLAATRGSNWGIGKATRTSQAITRPIRIDCSADKLVLSPDKPGEPPIVIPLRTRTEESIDGLADAIRDRVQSWGIAGRSMYWKPQLVLSVGPSGEGRFADLENLLADSGFDVSRK